MSKRVFFLGAGASVGAGFPVTDRLLSMVRSGLKDDNPLGKFIDTFGFGGEPVDKFTRPVIVDAIGLLDSCIRDVRPLSVTFNLKQEQNLRIQLTTELARVLMDAGEKTGRPIRVPRDARDQLGATERLLADYFSEFAKILSPRDRTIMRREDMDSAKWDAVITTNYDTNMDVALYELVYDEDYHKLSDVFLGSSFRDPESDDPALSEPAAAIDFLKLHGSLNWLYCPRCSRIYIAAFGYSVLYLQKKRKPEEKQCHCGYWPLNPVLIAPSVLQDIVNPHLQAIWIEAYNVLEMSNRWMFVGYSLPAEDLAIRSLLYRALDGMRENYGREPQITIVCPEEDKARIGGVYRNFFKDCDVRVIPRRFEDYVSELESL